ncbi:MAG: CoA transferase, partial [Proteobacteria bacterium]|nr:CoA transferase [Pseudomonadota bacterium]
REDVTREPWFASASGRHEHIDSLYATIAAVLPQRDSAGWLEALARLDVPCSRVNSLEDLLDDPHLADVGFFDVGPRYPGFIKRKLPQPIEFGGIPSLPDEPPPQLGADTRSVLEDCGYSAAEIEALLGCGAARACMDI